MVKNVWIAHAGSFLTVNMYRCKNITGGPFEHVTPGEVQGTMGPNIFTEMFTVV